MKMDSWNKCQLIKTDRIKNSEIRDALTIDNEILETRVQETEVVWSVQSMDEKWPK